MSGRKRREASTLGKLGVKDVGGLLEELLPNPEAVERREGLDDMEAGLLFRWRTRGGIQDHASPLAPFIRDYGDFHCLDPMAQSTAHPPPACGASTRVPRYLIADPKQAAKRP